MHTRVFSSFFFYFSLFLSFPLFLCSLFPLLFRDRCPLPPSQALSPFLPLFLSLSLSFSVLRNTLHRRSSVLERSTLYTPRCSLENPTLFQPGRPMGAPAPVVSASAYIAFFVIRHSTGSKFHSFSLYAFSREQSLRATSGTLAQMFSGMRDSLSASFGCLPWLLSRRYSYPPPRLAAVFPLISRRSFNSDRICRSAASSRALLSYTISRSQFLRDLDIHEISI